MQEICDKAVRDKPSLLRYIPDWFVTRERVAMWYDGSEYCDDDDKDNFFKWYKGYKKRKAQKASIKEEFMAKSQASMSEDEKRDTEALQA